MARAVSFLFLFSISTHLLAVFLMLLFIEKKHHRTVQPFVNQRFEVKG